MHERRISVQRGNPPLQVRDGLTASRVRVPESHEGISAFDFVWHLVATQRHRHPEDNEAAVAQRFADGLVVIAPKYRYARPEEALRAGEDVWFYRTPAPEKKAPFACKIIHEDEDIVVVDKPPFMATMPRGMHITETVTVQMRRALNNGELTPAHRLDRNTAGVLLMTKRKELRGRYQDLFAKRGVKKTYEALAPIGDTTPGTWWENRIEKVAGQVQGHIVAGSVNARTFVQAVQPLDCEQQAIAEAMHGELPPLARYVLQPYTGKTHQLRLHMWHAGHAIVGDPAYPKVIAHGSESFDQPMHLLASTLRFEDPISGAQRVFHSSREILRLT